MDENDAHARHSLLRELLPLFATGLFSGLVIFIVVHFVGIDGHADDDDGPPHAKSVEAHTTEGVKPDAPWAPEVDLGDAGAVESEPYSHDRPRDRIMRRIEHELDVELEWLSRSHTRRDMTCRGVRMLDSTHDAQRVIDTIEETPDECLAFLYPLVGVLHERVDVSKPKGAVTCEPGLIAFHSDGRLAYCTTKSARGKKKAMSFFHDGDLAKASAARTVKFKVESTGRPCLDVRLFDPLTEQVYAKRDRTPCEFEGYPAGSWQVLCRCKGGSEDHQWVEHFCYEPSIDVHFSCESEEQ